MTWFERTGCCQLEAVDANYCYGMSRCFRNFLSVNNNCIAVESNASEYIQRFVLELVNYFTSFRSLDQDVSTRIVEIPVRALESLVGKTKL
ncbi:hypothetical protein MPTK1_5g10390 [Marchantia polymorpha subsp. ruderalis]|uniref:Uncharacterized protein n=1 Tax=Marchantia polymorpha subsp. ruderalis TaxID=1480154 RepID=A0AAF6BGX6_MARPO|nr:hypothetical protein Mp_5g10390 [Marchantia polymorpha subsp. ruderalis]